MSLIAATNIDVREFKQTRRLVNAGAEKLLGEPQPVLDKGYIKLVDYMGVDETVVQAARHSFDRGVNFEDEEGNRKLINFLMNHRHTSPFEQPALVFEVKAPIFVFREWHRHRTAKLNEMSGRYAELPEEYYIPEKSRYRAAQSKANKQGSQGEIDHVAAAEWFNESTGLNSQQFDIYHYALEAGMSREVARINLPLSTYSKMVWQMDLHNLLHFLKLRTAKAAQFEIRAYADIIEQFINVCFPKVYAAWVEHVKNAVTFNKTELQLLERMLSGETVKVEDIDALLRKVRG